MCAPRPLPPAFAPLLHRLTRHAPVHRASAGDVDSTVAVEISNSFAYAGFEFATVDNAQPFTTDTSGCQSGPIQLPSGGWEVAADDSDTLAALLGPRTQFGA